MNILRVIGTMNPSSGGPCEGIRNSIPEMKKQGVHNEVVSLDDPAASFIADETFLIHALGPGKAPWHYNAKLVPWLLQHLVRFDVVIVHGLWLYTSYATLKAIRQFKQEHKTDLKFYVMPHGMLDPYFQKAPERRVKALRNRIYWSLIEEKVVNEADGLLFTCESELYLAREAFRPYRPRRELNIGYGIAEPPLYNPGMRRAFQQKCPELRASPYILFLSRIHEKKGVDILIKAYSNITSKLMILKREHPMAGFLSEAEFDQEFPDKSLPKLIIAGPGLNTGYGKKIQQMVLEDPALSGAVFFPGMLSDDAKWGAFYGCEAFVLPSHQENFGISVAEAMACGKAVLITNKVNIWPKIMKYGGGLVLEDSLSGVENLLKSFLNLSSEDKKAMGVQAHDLYQQNFAIGPVARQFMQALNK